MVAGRSAEWRSSLKVSTEATPLHRKKLTLAVAPLDSDDGSEPIANLGGIARGLTAVHGRQPRERNRKIGIGSQVRRWLSFSDVMAR